MRAAFLKLDNIVIMIAKTIIPVTLHKIIDCWDLLFVRVEESFSFLIGAAIYTVLLTINVCLLFFITSDHPHERNLAMVGDFVRLRISRLFSINEYLWLTYIFKASIKLSR